ncbi:MAG: hypothetical protein JNL57_06790 [Bacteroidetes bacterium]|nr:hypothetical protein [Bacteroidota bacterium]
MAEVKVTNKLYQEAANQFVLLHKPVENNFSHVELTGKGNLSRSDKLEMRSKIVNNAILKYDSGVQPRGLEKTSMYFLIVINIIVFIFTFWIYFNSKKQPIG